MELFQEIFSGQYHNSPILQTLISAIDPEALCDMFGGKEIF